MGCGKVKRIELNRPQIYWMSPKKRFVHSSKPTSFLIGIQIWSNSCGPNELHEIAFKGNHKWFTTLVSQELPLSTICSPRRMKSLQIQISIFIGDRFIGSLVHWHGWLRTKLNCKCGEATMAMAMATAANNYGNILHTVARHHRKKFSTSSNYYVNGCQSILPQTSEKWMKWMKAMCLEFQRRYTYMYTSGLRRSKWMSLCRLSVKTCVTYIQTDRFSFSLLRFLSDAHTQRLFRNPLMGNSSSKNGFVILIIFSFVGFYQMVLWTFLRNRPNKHGQQ